MFPLSVTPSPAGGSGVNTGDGSTNTDPPVSPDTEQLALQLRDQTREIENLRAVRARCLQVAVTQFQKGENWSVGSFCCLVAFGVVGFFYCWSYNSLR